MVSFLVLDYNRPKELALCLNSIVQNAKFEHKIILLSNGGNQDYVWDFYQKGKIDHVILNNRNSGGGYGTTDLFRFCPTEYAIYVQEDQILAREMTENDIGDFVKCLDENEKCKVIGLAGDQCQGRYSERAQFVNVEWYNAFTLQAPNGGPGPFHDRMHNEEYVQTNMDKLGLEFKVWSPLFFSDNGKQSVREYPCGGVTLHFTDTKQLFVLVPPKEKYVFPHLTDQEWDDVINGKWKDGSIPEKDKPHSFKVW